MVIFASDLDNTLIYSYKHASTGDVCVEYKDGKALSFMPKDVYEALVCFAEKHLFVPVTTRSLEQYRRVNFGFTPRFALTANGAVLLENGEPDEDWHSETRRLTFEKLPDIKNNAHIGNIRVVEELYYQIKSTDPQDTVNHLRAYTDASRFTVCHTGNKVYVIPRALNKGLAARRLKERLKTAGQIIAAGDSELDIPMLNEADTAICPEGLVFEHRRVIKLKSDTPAAFARGVIETVLDFIDNEGYENEK